MVVEPRERRRRERGVLGGCDFRHELLDVALRGQLLGGVPGVERVGELRDGHVGVAVLAIARGHCVEWVGRGR